MIQTSHAGSLPPVSFHVLAFDQDDSEAARAIGHALGWDQGDSPIDLKSDLFAKYSLMEKPKGT